jgi:hypothetical protein
VARVACEHEHFQASAEVNRLEDVKKFAVDVRIKCVDCDTPFRFLGFPGGISLDRPTVSVDCTEARLPIVPGGLYDD